MSSAIVKGISHVYRLFRAKPMAEWVDMGGRHVIVTGSSPGSIGYETARTLAGWGADVVATCLRDARLLERTLYRDLKGHGQDSGKVTVRRLDLTEAPPAPGSIGRGNAVAGRQARRAQEGWCSNAYWNLPKPCGSMLPRTWSGMS